jgi:hypothetical protein
MKFSVGLLDGAAKYIPIYRKQVDFGPQIT